MIAFGSGAAAGTGLMSNGLVQILFVILAIVVFLKYCGWAKKFQLSAGFKKMIFLLTGVGLIAFNLLYSMGNKAIEHNHDWNLASIALAVSLVWALVFAFTLMAETK